MEHSQSSKKYQGKPGMCCQAAMTSAYSPCQPPSVRSTVPDHCSAKGHHSLPVKSLHKGPHLKVVGWVFSILEECIMTTRHLICSELVYMNKIFSLSDGFLSFCPTVVLTSILLVFLRAC